MPLSRVSPQWHRGQARNRAKIGLPKRIEEGHGEEALKRGIGKSRGNVDTEGRHTGEALRRGEELKTLRTGTGYTMEGRGVDDTEERRAIEDTGKKHCGEVLWTPRRGETLMALGNRTGERHWGH